MKYKISIIIPVFNVEGYIRDALESIVRQTIGFENLEVIMVDDCSTDKSGEIMDEYASKYDNFKAINLSENSGAAGKPRNVGIKSATSDYLMFLDPDDYYTDDACSTLYDKITSENADIVTGKFSILQENGELIEISSWYQLYSTGSREIKNIKKSHKRLLYNSPPSIWVKIFKRDFIEENNILSPEGIPGQDLAFVIHCFLKTDNVIYINEDILVLRKRETKDRSISYNRNYKYIDGLIQAYHHIYQICRDNHVEEDFPLIMEKRLPYWFNQFILSDLTILEKNKALQSIRPLLVIYHESGSTLPDNLMPALECIVQGNLDDALLLFNQLKASRKDDVKDLKLEDIDHAQDISIIIITPKQGNIELGLSPLLNTIYPDKIELIMVDDGYMDNTGILEKLKDKYENLKVVRHENKGVNLSKLRNIGIEESTGKYITFLDYKYEMNIDNLVNMVNYAYLNNLDSIKGYIKVFNDIGALDYDPDQLNIIDTIAGNTTLDIVVKKEFMDAHNIRFDEKYEIKTETLFYADLLVHNPRIEYYNSYIYKKDTKDTHPELCPARELDSYLTVWELIGETFKKAGVNYYKLRLPIIVTELIHCLIFNSSAISEGTFNRLNKFLDKNMEYLKDLELPERQKLVFDSILDGDYLKFLSSTKKRLIIVGHDLKFIEPALKYLEDDYILKIDKWGGHNSHNEKRSIELLNWADIIFCEWLLGNSVWYSKRKSDHQKLVIRAHRHEIIQDYGNHVDFENVDRVISINYYYLELFSKTFQIPRQKMILIGNFIETNIYNGIKTGDSRHNLALVGYVPRLKGLLRGLKILKMLRETDDKFKLYLLGKHYTELSWIWNNPEERSYYEECEDFIRENGMEDAVVVNGWVERSKLFNEVGYVLSLSDIESFHLAPAEGLADKTLALLLNWDGAEYVYPKEIIFNSIDEIKDMIISTYKDDHEYQRLQQKMRDYVLNEFNMEKFIYELKSALEND